MVGGALSGRCAPRWFHPCGCRGFDGYQVLTCWFFYFSVFPVFLLTGFLYKTVLPLCHSTPAYLILQVHRPWTASVRCLDTKSSKAFSRTPSLMRFLVFAIRQTFFPASAVSSGFERAGWNGLRHRRSFP